MDQDKLVRDIIRKDIREDRLGRQLTPQAVEKAVAFGESLKGSGLNFGQIRDASIKHVTNDILK